MSALIFRQTTTIPKTITPSKQRARDEISAATDAFLRTGGKVEVLPPPEYRPYLESTRKQDPEIAARRAKVRPKKRSEFGAPRDLIALGVAMEICGYDSFINTQREKFAALCDRG